MLSLGYSTGRTWLARFLINYIQTLLHVVMFDKIRNIPTLLSSDKISNVNRKFVEDTIISNIYVIALMIILRKHILMLRDDK